MIQEFAVASVLGHAHARVHPDLQDLYVAPRLAGRVTSHPASALPPSVSARPLSPSLPPQHLMSRTQQEHRPAVYTGQREENSKAAKPTHSVQFGLMIRQQLHCSLRAFFNHPKENTTDDFS